MGRIELRGPGADQILAKVIQQLPCNAREECMAVMKEDESTWARLCLQGTAFDSCLLAHLLTNHSEMQYRGL